MPFVSDNFVKSAQLLAAALPALLEKKSAAPAPAVNPNVAGLASMTADTLVSSGFVTGQRKEAAEKALLSHEQALHILNKLAVQKLASVSADSVSAMGAPVVKKANVMVEGEQRPSDSALLQRLGLG